jgi:hypothetical protein
VIGLLLAFWRVLYALVAAMAMLRTDLGDDFQAEVMGGDSAVGFTGTSTATGATSLTMGSATWATDEWRGHVVVTGATYGIVGTNSATVLTIDKWYAPATPGGTAASTPGTGTFVIVSGGGPAWWVGLTETSITPAVGDTQLSGELTVEGFARSVGTWAHTAGASTYTLTNTYTMVGGTSRTIRGAAVFNFSRILNGGQRMVFETVMPNPPTLVPDDQLTTTYTITL